MLWTIISNLVTIAFLGGVILMLYGYLIEPHLIEVSHFKKPHRQKGLASLRVIQISDIHMGYHVSVKALQHLVQQVNALDPDVVVLTGDVYDNGERYQQFSEVVRCLQSLKAPYGKYVIPGNHEYAGNAVQLLQETARSAGLVMLMNEATTIPHPQLKVGLAGADCAIYGVRRPEFCKELEAGHFNFLLLHQADAIHPYLEYPIDVVLSGHTHGGQVRLPWLGTPILPEMGKRFVQGWYSFEESERTALYVNRGFGMTMLPFRFMSRPEITVIDLVPD